MDPRQPQHPFSRNTASPYGRGFPPNTNQAPYSPSSHPPNAAPYSDHQRRPSDPPYSSFSQRQYGGEGPTMSGSTHSRHQSSSSIGHAPPVSRGMPPPSSPQQRTQLGYGQSSHAPSGPPNAFSSGRELPALPPGRPASTADRGMSIHSILGGPPASAPPSHYSPATTGAGPQTAGSVFARHNQANHGSPRSTAAPDYAPFRRPLTPEQRSYEPRDHRANSAGSPQDTRYTPDARRFGTPQGYGQRVMQTEERREPIRVTNPNSVIPPRPSSQPAGYNAQQRPAEPRPTHNEGIFGRREPVRADSLNREPPYHRAEYEERRNPGSYSSFSEQQRAFVAATTERQREERAEREREREATLQREREQRERLEHSVTMQQEYAHQQAQRNVQTYNRPVEREVPPWLNRNYEPPRPAYEPIPEQAPHQREPLPGHDYPRTTASQYSSHPAYAPNEQNRYPPSSQPASASHQLNRNPPSIYDIVLQREREAQRQAAEEQQRQAMYGQTHTVPFQSQESPTRRQPEDAQQPMQQQVQRNFLGIQEINRKGRISPLPQAVQGAQGQIGGPGGEPGIKSEFGRMFSGIGSGVGARGISSPITAGPQNLPSGQLRRDDLEGIQGLDSPIENGGYKIARSSSRGGRRRRLKDEDGRDDDSSTGRRTPSGNGRGKRPKTNHYGSHHNHQQHRADPQENTSSPSQSNLTPFKNVKGLPIPSPPDTMAVPVPHHHHAPRHHHHHHHVTPAKPAAAPFVIEKAPKKIVKSDAVLDSVAHKPRNHLGSEVYDPILKPAGIHGNGQRTKRGFTSTPRPLPRFTTMDENCTFTVKVSRIHLDPESREEITARRAVWGTDIYTEDSDVIAACIHHGWFRGEWAPDIDTTLLGLELDDEPPDTPKEFLTEPPPRGPMPVPKDMDLDITVLILPTLEKYASSTRFGIASREWGVKRDGYKGENDGLSYKIHSIRWVNGIGALIGRSGTQKKKQQFLTSPLDDDELADEEAWSDLLNAKMQDGVIPENSFERGANPLPLNPLKGIKDIGTRSWFTKPANLSQVGEGMEDIRREVGDGVGSQDVGGAGVEEVVEGREVDERRGDGLAEGLREGAEPVVVDGTASEIERVTERMIENANAGGGGA